MNPTSGGPCEGIRNSVLELSKLNVLNEVACLDAPDAQYLGGDSFPIHMLGPGKGPWCYSSKLLPWLVDHLPNFDAVIVHGVWLYHSFAVHRAIKLLKQKYKHSQQLREKLPKVFIMPHGMLDPYFQTAPSRKLKAIRNTVYWKLIESRVVRQATGLLFTCESELKLARVPFRPYKPKYEINVGYGITAPPAYLKKMEEAFKDRCPQIQNEPYFLFLGRIHEKKGVDLLLKAYAKLIKTLTEVQYEQREIKNFQWNSNIESSDHAPLPKLVIAGPGIETPFGQEMQKYVRSSKEIRDMVYFPGMLAGDAKWGAFYGCETFVLPSHQENFGIAVVEALACCKPVLLTNKINIWQEIADTGAGLVADDTVEGVLSMLNSWLNLREVEKQSYGEKAGAVYLNHFAVMPAVIKLVDVIKHN
ncbi:glycosyltransferase involved in cell wall biosynthesis [Pontibacter ramchanderi]|uniref:Glycosyltransferase involved in cell wall biosynthesis n=2 Tax=Pontibacter ramchanderi TaxID=1179743 RepID=A0A2N3V1N7_9BACT|nr:glycosyltransferase involved in cell wall biosynthesis [Pontibacter ramchanderi]